MVAIAKVLINKIPTLLQACQYIVKVAAEALPRCVEKLFPAASVQEKIDISMEFQNIAIDSGYGNLDFTVFFT